MAPIDIDDVVPVVSDRPEHASVVITGRDAPQPIIDVADTVSEIANVNHADQSGITAKQGIDQRPVAGSARSRGGRLGVPRSTGQGSVCPSRLRLAAR